MLTVPHHLLYSCLYVRDEHDRPVRLRSVHGSRPWQFPGGNSEDGEDPLMTARREALEETGLGLGQGSPRLLLTHYLHPGPGRILGKTGFIFDDGRLDAQLGRIRLDASEHDMRAVHGLDECERLMGGRRRLTSGTYASARRGDRRSLDLLCLHPCARARECCL